MATYFIGDIQGCFDALDALLARIEFDPVSDHVYLTGDLVNRGGQDLTTLRFLRAHDACITAVLGNHDLHLLATAQGLRAPRPHDTFQEVLEAPDAEQLLAWVRNRPLLHRVGPLTLIHAGLLPEWDLAEAEDLARALEEKIQGGRLAELLAGEGPRGPWSALGGKADEPLRHRLALDAFVSLRFLEKGGGLAREVTVSPEEAPKGLTPWFQAQGRRSAGDHLVHGHWASLGVRVSPKLWSLDGGCVWGGSLCAIRLEDEARFEVFRPAPAT